MSYFDSIKTKTGLESFTLGFYRSAEQRQPFVKGATGISAASTIFVAVLVGLQDKSLDIAERAHRWLQEAIEDGERTTDRDASSADWHQQGLSHALALIKFLRGQGVDRESFARCATLTERAWRTGVPQFDRKSMVEDQLEYYMPTAFSGGLYADAIRNFEEYEPGVQPDIRKVRSQRGVAYLLCQHKLLGMHDPAQLRRAVSRVLDTNLQHQWLGTGIYSKALHWLMIAYAEDAPDADPREVVLKAYDHMPKVPRPDWLT